MRDPYEVAIADPPWSYRDRNTNGARGAVCKYDLMSDEELIRLDPGALMAPDSVLFMWATCPRLPFALRLLGAWGFEFKTVAFCWVKTGAISGPRQAFRRALVPRVFDRVTAQRAWEAVEHLIAAPIAFGLGHHTRGNVELVLLGQRGRGLDRVDRAVRQVVLAPRGEHSAKPEEVQDRIERLYGERRRLEMFARRPRAGWDLFGNQVDGSVEVPSRLI